MPKPGYIIVDGKEVKGYYTEGGVESSSTPSSIQSQAEMQNYLAKKRAKSQLSSKEETTKVEKKSSGKKSYEDVWASATDKYKARFGGDKAKAIQAMKDWNLKKSGKKETTSTEKPFVADVSRDDEQTLEEFHYASGGKPGSFKAPSKTIEGGDMGGKGVLRPQMDTKQSTMAENISKWTSPSKLFPTKTETQKTSERGYTSVKPIHGGNITHGKGTILPELVVEAGESTRKEKRLSGKIAKTEAKIKKQKGGAANKARLGQLSSKLTAQKKRQKKRKDKV